MLKKLLLIICLAFTSLQTLTAVLNVKVEKGVLNPIPIAISPFFAPAGYTQIASEMLRVITTDLQVSGFFKPLDSKAFIQKPQDLIKGVRFPDWRMINAQVLITGTLHHLSDDEIQIDCHVYDIYSEKELEKISFIGKKSNWRYLAHMVSNGVYKRITGEEGYFTSRVIYVSESGPHISKRDRAGRFIERRIKRLAMMDLIDGNNHIFLTDGRYTAMTPRLSPQGDKVAYFAFVRNRARVYLYDLRSGKQTDLGSFNGMTFAPRFSPDGNMLVFSLTHQAATSLHLMDFSSGQTYQLTKSPAIDTSPCFTPNGKQIVFVSDRGGSPQLYIMNTNGANQRRISFGPGSYYTPVVSPDGKYIAFAKRVGDMYHLGVMRIDGTGERHLTSSYFLEGPCWANNAVILFTRRAPIDKKGRGGTARMYSIHITGYNERELITPMDASDPTCSMPTKTE